MIELDAKGREGSVRDVLSLFGIRSGSVRDPVRDPFGVRSASVWNPFRVRSKSGSGSVRGPYRVHSGSIPSVRPSVSLSNLPK